MRNISNKVGLVKTLIAWAFNIGSNWSNFTKIAVEFKTHWNFFYIKPLHKVDEIIKDYLNFKITKSFLSDPNT